MRKIEKNEPSFFKEAKRKVKQPKTSKAWENKIILEIKTKLKDYIVNEQNFMCAYCEKALENIEKLSIDHFKKRALFPELTLDYNNLFVSCKNNRTCEKHKDTFQLLKEDYNKIIHPVFENPNNYFEYYLDGTINPKYNLNKFDKQKADFTIKVFNLNDESLVRDRRDMIDGILNFLAQIESLEDLKKWFRKYFSWLERIWEKKDEIINNRH